MPTDTVSGLTNERGGLAELFLEGSWIINTYGFEGEPGTSGVHRLARTIRVGSFGSLEVEQTNFTIIVAVKWQCLLNVMCSV